MKKSLVLAAAGLVILGVALAVLTHLAVVQTSVKDGSTDLLPYQDISFTFNRDLTDNNAPIVTVDPETPGTVSVTGKVLTFKPKNLWDVNQQYRVTVTYNKLPGFQKTKEVSFTPKYVDFKDYPAEVQKSLVPTEDPPTD